MTDIVKRKPGRPQKFNKEQLITIKLALDEYINGADDPTLPGFIVTHQWSLTKDYLSSRAEFSDSVKRLIYKQEQFLLSQMKNPTMAIFRLKQPIHGYADKTEVENKNINLNINADKELGNNFLKYLKDSTKQG